MPATKTDPDELPLTEEYLEKRAKFRGVLYRLRELPISEYDKIQTQATTKAKGDDGIEYERFDPTLRDRLLLKASIVEPTNLNVGKLGTRLAGALNRMVSELHYVEEVDELKAAEQKADEEDAEGKKGNG